jgi:hypothetical protein
VLYPHETHPGISESGQVEELGVVSLLLASLVTLDDTRVILRATRAGILENEPEYYDGAVCASLGVTDCSANL